MSHPRLSKILDRKQIQSESISAEQIEHLQLKMLRIQQGIWNSGRRAIILFEGFDAAGKGSTIRTMLEKLDPRGVRVEAIGPPKDADQKRHYLLRFWKALPDPGTITVFDRSWYGRVLVERVEKLIPKKRWHEAYDEIKNFETTLTQDGIDLVKIFLAVSPLEELRRFEARMKDPYKQWKLTDSDIEAHRKWDAYVEAADNLFKYTHTDSHPWHIIPSDSKIHTHHATLKVVSSKLSRHEKWTLKKAEKEKLDKRNALMHKEIQKFRRRWKAE